MKRFGSFLIGVMLFCSVPAMAQQSQQEEPAVISIYDAFARLSPTGSGAAYMTLHNTGDTAVDLLRAASELFKKIEIHTIEEDENGVMRMMPVDAITLPAGKKVDLAPGGYHIMMMGMISTDNDHHNAIPLTLYFNNEASIKIEVPVQNKEKTDHGGGHHH